MASAARHDNADDETEGVKGLSQAAVVAAISQRILQGELVPGQRLVEAELCELLGVSRGTVRAALMDLVHEGLVERIANRGARVRVVTLEEALQIAEVRLAVESLCVAKAAEKITDKEIAHLRSLTEKIKKLAAEGDIIGFADATHQIFETYVRIADQPVAAEILSRLRARNTRHRFRLSYRPGRAQAALPFWLERVDAICNRDPEVARASLERHAGNVKEAMTALARDDKPFATPYPGGGASADGRRARG